MNNTEPKKNRPKDQPQNKIDKLITFFKNLNVKKPKSGLPDYSPDYSSWNQTEAEYQKEQAEWLANVKKKKQHHRQD